MKNVLLIVMLACNALMAVSQKTFRIENSITITNPGSVLSELILMLPVPQSDNYQTIHSVDYNSGSILTAANNDNIYLRENTSGTPAPGAAHTLAYRADLTLYPMYIDMTQFETLYPYNTTSELYRKYTSSVGEYIDLDNAGIRSTANRLWTETNGRLIDYAYACYVYAAGNFGYLNPYTGLHPIAKILSDGGGDCGNLSSIFINLLRVKGIPARHLVMVRPNGSYHVVADFYLENYGWIPVDVTMKHDYPSGNYFGYHAGDGIIMSTDICSMVSPGSARNDYNAVLLQNYLYWYWCSSGGGDISGSHRVTNQLVSANKATLKTVGSRSVSVECPSGGETYYVARIHKSVSPDSSEKSFRFDNGGDCVINDLSPETAYTISVDACRTVDNIQTRMETSTFNFTTKASPVSTENPDNISIRTSGRQLFIRTNERGKGYVHSISGQLLMSLNLSEGTNIFTLPHDGIFVLKITSQSRPPHAQRIITNYK